MIAGPSSHFYSWPCSGPLRSMTWKSPSLGSPTNIASTNAWAEEGTRLTPAGLHAGIGVRRAILRETTSSGLDLDVA